MTKSVFIRSRMLTLKGSVSASALLGLSGVTGSAQLNLRGSSADAVSALSHLAGSKVNAALRLTGSAASIAVPLRQGISAASKRVALAVSVPRANLRGSPEAIVSKLAQLTGSVSVSLRLRGDAGDVASVITQLSGARAVSGEVTLRPGAAGK